MAKYILGKNNEANDVMLNFINLEHIPEFVTLNEAVVQDFQEDFLVKIVEELNGGSTVVNPGVTVNDVAQHLYPDHGGAEDLLTLDAADLDWTFPSTSTSIKSSEDFSRDSPSLLEMSSTVSENMEMYIDMSFDLLGNEYPVPSVSSTAFYDDTAKMAFVPSSDTEENAPSPQAEVVVERKRKRGRRSKSEAGLYPPSAKKQRKAKVYEIAQPLKDTEQERKRLNAVNAKKHRDLQKQMRLSLVNQIAEINAEKDILQVAVETLRKSEAILSKQLGDFKEQAFSLVSAIGKES